MFESPVHTLLCCPGTLVTLAVLDRLRFRMIGVALAAVLLFLIP